AGANVLVSARWVGTGCPLAWTRMASSPFAISGAELSAIGAVAVLRLGGAAFDPEEEAVDWAVLTGGTFEAPEAMFVSDCTAGDSVCGKMIWGDATGAGVCAVRSEVAASIPASFPSPSGVCE